jgi:VCBS repeat-containing protein
METMTMADNFNDPFAQNLVGLWDFLSANPLGDTGNADGVAQNGWLHGNANISGDRLHLDGHGDYFDVDGEIIGGAAGDSPNAGDDDPFDLSEGTISVQFSQDHVDDGTLVNRGEYDDKNDEGFFQIATTKYGQIEVKHYSNGEDLKLKTEKDLFDDGDEVKVTYTWDATSGGTLLVENLTTGAQETINFSQTGLTMEIGDEDDESFTFGAREDDDGEYDEYFEGSIAYVAIYDRDIINNPPATPDGIVDGTAGADLIDTAYEGDPEGDSIDAGDAILPGEAPNDDIVDAGAGNDTILSGEGDDDVYAGSGADSVDGGAGDDLIFGDSNFDGGSGPGTVRESFEWDLAGASNGDDLGGFIQDTGNVNVTFSILQETGSADTEFESTDQNVSGIDADGNPVDDNSSLSSTTNGSGNEADYRLDFSAPVEDVSFRVNDIDGDGVVRISAFDADGNPIEVNLTAGSNLTLSDTDGVAGNDTADSNGGYLDDSSSEYSILVTIPGPVSRIEIEHDQDGGNNSGINVTDIYFDAPVADTGADGNDVLEGGEGDDSIFGEGGDDTLEGGDGSDELTGGDGADMVSGGADADTIFGGAGDDVDGGSGGFNANPALNTDLDVLDLTGQGPFFLDNVTPDSNGNGIDGTVVFVNPDGTPNGLTLTFTEIEEVIGEEINRDPDAMDDTATIGEDDGATVINLTGNDTDPDAGDDLEVTAIDTTGTIGTVSINPDGEGVTYNPNGQFESLAVGETATDTFTYTVDDGNGGTDTATVTVTITGSNDGPTAMADVATASEDGPAIDINLTGNDTDPDASDDLEIESIDTTGTLGSVTINPDDDSVSYDANGAFESLGVGETATDTFTYTVTDGNGGMSTETVTVTVEGVNDAPTAVDDASTTDFNTPVTFDVLDNDTDPDTSDILEITGATSPNGTVDNNGDGTLTFTPTPGFEGPAEITYTISDGNGGTDEGVWTVTVAEQPLDGIVSGTDDGELIDVDYLGDPEGDRVDNNDEILPGEGPNDDIIEAGGGNDTIIAGEGDDDVFAGDGDDRVHGGTGDDILRGEDGEDTINGGAGDDTVDGGNDDDEINTGDGSDVVEGGDGNDLINTGNGEFAPDLGFPNDDGTPAPGFPFGFAADDNPDDDRDSVDGGAGNDTISTGDDADTITGGSGDDVIDGGIDDDEITGDDGADRIVGGEGNDLIDGGIGDDTIYAGNDPVLGLDQLNIEDDGSNPIFPADPRPDNGMDTVFGGEGNDLIFGADDDDVLYGEEGNDTIDGEIDDDFIDGGIGDDSLLGGQGNDTIEGGDGNDFIDGGDQKDTLLGGDGNDTIFGGNGDDSIDGGDGDDLIDGGTGGDSRLFGGAGNDTIFGSTGRDTIDGGDGDDLIDLGNNGPGDVADGGADRDTFVNVTAGDTVDGGGAGDDFDTLDLRGSAPAGGSLQVVFTGPDANGNGFDGVVNYFDSDGNAAGTLEFTDIEDVIPCFTPGTLIATPQGERRVEDLAVGDRVITRDNGIQAIRWVGARVMTGQELARAEHLRPVLIRQGALGGGLPERDMLVSPQHRVLMANEKTALYFDESEVLVAAKHLTGMDGIDVVEVSQTTYIHVMFDQHEVILSDGAWSESFQPGDQTLAAMGDAQRAEILELFPELETVTGINAYTSARRSLKKHEARLLSQ